VELAKGERGRDERSKVRTDLEGLLGIQLPGSKDELLCGGEAHEAGQPLRSSGTSEGRRWWSVQQGQEGARLKKKRGQVEEESQEGGKQGRHPGMMASFVSVRPILAFAPAALKSHARAISSPPPSAAPSIAAMVGMGSD
jgi:hypothetical protein